MDTLLRDLLAELSVPAPEAAPAPVAAFAGDHSDFSLLIAEYANQTAAAVAAALAGATTQQASADLSVLADLTEAIKNLDSRVTGLANQNRAFGSSGPSNISNDATREIGRVTVKANETDYATQTTLAAAKTALEDRLPKNAKQFADGEYRTAGGKVSLSLATPNGSFHLSNPAGSGRSITITEFSLAATGSADVAYFKDATSSGTAADVFMPNRAYEGVATTVGVLRVGVGVLSGGTQLSPVSRLGSNAPERIPYTAVLLPGQSLAVRFIATTTLDAYCSATWIETAL